MSSTIQDIERWFKEGLRQHATHVVVVCDTFEYDEYPVYVIPGQDVHRIVAEKNAASMQRVMEVYKMSMDMDVQLKQHRSFNY